MKFVSILTDLVFPEARCLSCNEPRQISPGHALCDRCEAALEQLRLEHGLCPHCLSPKRADLPCRYCAEGGMAYLSAAFSPYRYHGPAQRLVGALKFQGVYLAAEPLVEGMLRALDGRQIDALVPVPLHSKRLRERGFDQALLLCNMLSDQLHIPVLQALKRLVNSRPQSGLAHSKRQANVKDIFDVVKPVEGVHLLLVDDVRTTGHTARSCAKALKMAGAADVCLLTATVAAPYETSERPSASETARSERS